MAPKVGSVQSDPTYCWRVATLTPLPRAPLFLTPKSDPRDPVAISFREPHVAVGTGGKEERGCTDRDSAAVLGNHPGGRDLPDPAVARFREPQVAVGAGGNAKNAKARDAAVLGDHSRGRDFRDHAAAIHEELGKPQVAVAAGRDVFNDRAGGDAAAVFGDHPGRGDLPDPAGGGAAIGSREDFREPHVAVGSGGDARWLRAGGDAVAVLGDYP